MADRYFSKASFDFLNKLAANNNRDWFQEHKQTYEDAVRSPALAFIADMADGLADVSPHFLCQAKKVGGSLMRVHRDVRFGKDKRPYKTNIGIQFRHEAGKDVHAPGFYLHVEPGGCFVGAGIWRPDAPALRKIRDAIVEDGEAWLAVSRDKVFARNYRVSGEALKTAPRGYDRAHPLLEDLKRKDFIAIGDLSDAALTSAKVKTQVLARFQTAAPYVRYLCKALDLRF